MRRFMTMALGIMPLLPAVSYAQDVDTSQDRVSIEVKAGETVSYMWRDRQFAKLFKCWGGPDTVEIYPDRATAENSSSASGTFADGSQGQGRPGFGEFVPNRVNWSSDISPERDFTVEFSQKIKGSQTNTVENACSQQTFHSKLDSVDNSISARAYFHVPEDVWLLRIRKNVMDVQTQTYHPVNISLKSAFPVSAGSATATNQVIPDLSLTIGSYNYFFVRPGSTVEMDVDWTSQDLKDAAIKVQFELHMLGSDKCETYLGDPKSSESFDLAKLWSDAIDPALISKDPDAYIEKMSCLRNHNYISGLLNYNHGQDLINLLNVLDKKFNLLNVDDRSGLGRVERVVTYMTLLDLSRNILVDLHTYCDPREIEKVFGLDPNIKITESNFTYVAGLLGRVRFLLNSMPLDVIGGYVSILMELHENGRTYGQVMSDGNSRAVIRQLADTLLDPSFEIFKPIRDILSEMPRTRTGAKIRSNVESSLNAGDQASIQLETQLRTSFLLFARSDTQIIDGEPLSEALANYMSEYNKMTKALREDMQWFLTNGDYSVTDSQAFKDMQQLGSGILEQVSGILDLSYSGGLGSGSDSNDLLQIESTKNIYKSVTSCLAGRN